MESLTTKLYKTEERLRDIEAQYKQELKSHKQDIKHAKFEIELLSYENEQLRSYMASPISESNTADLDPSTYLNVKYQKLLDCILKFIIVHLFLIDLDLNR